MRFSTTVAIAATPARVWEIYTDLVHWPDWTASVRSVTVLDPGPLHLGQRVRIDQPKLPTTVWTVTELEQGVSWSWTATAPFVHTTATHTVTPRGDGVVVEATIVQGGAFGGLIGRMTGGLTDRYLAMEAEGLKAVAERPGDSG